MNRNAYMLLMWLPVVFMASCTHGNNHSNPGTKEKQVPIFTADFREAFDTSRWISEIEPFPDSKVYCANGKLVIDSKGGVTVWLRKELEGNIEISYKRRVIVEGGIHDRLSDMNQFWMAQDPHRSNLFTRGGKFEEYDSLRLYYVGMGGNSNTTTRFRKYEGNGNKPVIGEYLDDDHLLEPGRRYHIRIVVRNGNTSFWVDGERYFSYQDPNPLVKGFFGFRAVHSRQEIEEFQINKLL